MRIIIISMFISLILCLIINGINKKYVVTLKIENINLNTNGEK